MEPSDQKKKTIIDYFDRVPSIGEFQEVFLRLENVKPSKGARNLLITSSTMGEGKSTIASFLAISASVFGNSPTILVDGDLRKPTIGKLFDLDSSPGLVGFLQGENTLEETIKPTVLENLKIITGGQPTPDADRILRSQRLKDLFRKLKSDFAFAVIDSAPVMMLSDALNLARAADGVILVVKAGATPREAVKRACDALQDSGASMLGVILNNVKRSLPYYYNYRYYDYKYRYENRTARDHR